MTFSRARVYGEILFEVALKTNKQDDFFGILKELSHMFQKNPLLIKFFNSPLISLEQKLEFLNSDKTLHNFVEILILNNDMHLFTRIFKFYEGFLDKHVGREDVTIFSSEPLTNKKQKEIIKALSEKVDVHFEVDFSLLDGYRVYWGSKLLPLSSKDFLHSIKETISFEAISNE